MGFLDFFRKPKEPVNLTVTYQDLPTWITSKKKVAEDQLISIITPIQKKIFEEKENTIKQIEVLETATLMNPNIPERVKHIMQGHRESYIQRLTKFLDTIEVGDHHTFNTIYEEFEDRVVQLNNGTAKNYQVLEEFFRDEASATAYGIGGIRKLMKEIKESIDTSSMQSVMKIEEEMQHIKDTMNRNEQHITKRNELQQKIVDEKKQFTNLSENLASLQQSNEYTELKKLQTSKVDFNKSKQELTKPISHIFSSLGSALKKHHRISLETDQIEGYMNDPIRVIVAGENPIAMLEKLKQSIEDNKIDLKESKKQKSIVEISRVNSEMIEKFRKKYVDLQTKLDDINHKIEQNSSEKELKEIKDKINRQLIKIDALKEEVDQIQISSPDYTKLQQLLEAKQVTLSFDD